MRQGWLVKYANGRIKGAWSASACDYVPIVYPSRESAILSLMSALGFVTEVAIVEQSEPESVNED